MATPDRLTWRELAALFEEEHRAGEHVVDVGPTDSGKSVLLVELAKLRARRFADDGLPARVTYMAAKPRDDSLERLDWPIIKKWPPGHGQFHVVVWPPYGDPDTVLERHRRIFRKLLNEIFLEGGQTVVVDEVAYFTASAKEEGLGLRGIIHKYLTVWRSNYGSFFGATQRPVLVPRAFWSEPKWLAVFRIEDYDDLRRVAEIGGKREGITDFIANELDDHEFLLIRRKGARRELYVSKVDL